jgi:hypothetical protein
MQGTISPQGHAKMGDNNMHVVMCGKCNFLFPPFFTLADHTVRKETMRNIAKII